MNKEPFTKIDVTKYTPPPIYEDDNDENVIPLTSEAVNKYSKDLFKKFGNATIQDKPYENVLALRSASAEKAWKNLLTNTVTETMEEDIFENIIPFKPNFAQKDTEDLLNYSVTATIKQIPGNVIYGISTNERMRNNKTENIIFATVGGPFVTFYECLVKTSDNNIKFVMKYKDSEPCEDFYCCDWSYYVPPINRGVDYLSDNSVSYASNYRGGFQILACAGKRGVIRIISPNVGSAIFSLLGHGDAVNEMRFHPHCPDQLFTFSKDMSVRLWNVWTGVMVCVFGGSEGHRSQVLYGDIDITGTMMLSCGMDHTMCIWRLDDSHVTTVVNQARKVAPGQKFESYMQNYPELSTDIVHSNYIDCGRWFGRMIVSKSCDSCLAVWMIGSMNDDEDKAAEPIEAFKLTGDSKVTVLHRSTIDYCKDWFIRFDLDPGTGLVALGNRMGQVFVYNLSDPRLLRVAIDDLEEMPRLDLDTANKAIVRQTRFADDGRILLCVFDNGTIVRMDMDDDDDGGCPADQ